MKSFKPCRVTHNGTRYQIEADRRVFRLVGENLPPFPEPEPETIAALVRKEAQRIRRNRTRRALGQTKRDLGLVRAPGGAFGGWE